MIIQPIEESLISGIAQNVFANYGQDVSLQQTAAVLLYPRVTEIKFKFSCDGWGSAGATVSFSDMVDLARTLADEEAGRDLCVVYVHKQKIKPILEADPEELPLVYFKSYHRLKDVENWLKPWMSCLIFQSTEHKRTVVFSDAYNYGKHHVLQALFPRLMPWYFEEKPLDAKEIAYLKTLTGDSMEDYTAALNERIDTLQLRIIMMKQEMMTYMQKRRERMLKRQEEEIAEWRSQIENLMSQLEDASRSHDSAVRQLSLLENDSFSMEESERIVNLITRSRDIRPISCSNGRLLFAIRGLLLNYPDVWEAIERNAGSVLYETYSTPLTRDQRVALCHALFVTETLHLKLFANFSLEIEGHGVGIQRNGISETVFESGAIGNPHLMHYNCLGSYASKIQKCLIDRDIEGAIAQCAASVSSVNLAETPVMRMFLLDLFKSTKKCLYTDSGEAMTPAEAVAWLEAQQEQ